METTGLIRTGDTLSTSIFNASLASWGGDTLVTFSFKTTRRYRLWPLALDRGTPEDPLISPKARMASRRALEGRHGELLARERG